MSVGEALNELELEVPTSHEFTPMINGEVVALDKVLVENVTLLLVMNVKGG